MDISTGFWPWQWWTMLVVLNTLGFFLCLFLFFRSREYTDAVSARYLKWMRLLGLIFVSVGLYRTVFVSSYLHQLAWFDTLANSSLLIRGLAFFAELSFAGLFMLALLRVNKEVPAAQKSRMKSLSWMNSLSHFLYTQSPFFFFGCIFIAQFFATSALITKLELLFAIEESLWGIAFLAITPLALAQLSRVSKASVGDAADQFRMLRVFTRMTASWCLLYCSYSVFYHLPIEYWPHIIADLQAGNIVFKTGWSAVHDALFVVNATRDFDEWGGVGFLIWHSGYFSVCIWMVLFLMNGPRILGQIQPQDSLPRGGGFEAETSRLQTAS